MQTSSDLALSVRDLSKTYRLGERDVLHGSLRDAIVRGARSALHLARGVRTARAGRARRARRRQLRRRRAARCSGSSVATARERRRCSRSSSGITEPTSGEARVWGRVGALLEVGTGFHPDLTGRENVFFNGAILGMKRTGDRAQVRRDRRVRRGRAVHRHARSSATRAACSCGSRSPSPRTSSRRS